MLSHPWKADTDPLTVSVPAAVCRPRVRVRVWPAATVTFAPVVTLVSAAGPATSTVVPPNRVAPLTAAELVSTNLPVPALDRNPPLTVAPSRVRVVPAGASRVPPLRVNVRAVVEVVVYRRVPAGFTVTGPVPSTASDGTSTRPASTTSPPMAFAVLLSLKLPGPVLVRVVTAADRPVQVRVVAGSVTDTVPPPAARVSGLNETAFGPVYARVPPSSVRSPPTAAMLASWRVAGPTVSAARLLVLVGAKVPPPVSRNP